MYADIIETSAEMEKLEAESDVSVETAESSWNSSCTSNQEENGTIRSSHAELYKISKSPLSQAERREKLLQEMKSRRNQVVNDKRGLLSLCIDDDYINHLEIEESPNVAEPMDLAVNHRWSRRRKQSKRSVVKLMLSEWFTEIPDDLESNWLVKLCPVGHRNLVVAQGQTTKAYNMKGILHKTFQSDLPGGNTHPPYSSSKITILDCIYNHVKKCYYILDLIAWYRFYDECETDFRFYVLKSKLDETPRLKVASALNEYCFFGVDDFPAELSLIKERLSHPYRINDQELKLDGLLFYHRATQYIQYINPLCGWLKPFMVPEMLHIAVNDGFIREMPENYVSMREYLNNTPAKPKKSRHGNQIKMET